MATSAQRLLDREETGMVRLRMSYQEWLDRVDEHAHSEWVDGEVIIYMPPDQAHQDGELFLATLLRLFVGMRDLGKIMIAPFEMRLQMVNASREPDIIFVAKEHLHRLTTKRLDGPADLAIEMLSKWTASYDRRVKLVEYARSGIRECWLVDMRPARRRFELFVLGDGDRYESIEPDERGCYHSMVVPGFWVDPRWFDRLPLPEPVDALMEIAGDEFLEMVRARKRD
ncbi:MAG TPA: Uma2 family endonuclease [Thermomicrobiales bacterium]|jgi:Uma2 family endonuclease